MNNLFKLLCVVKVFTTGFKIVISFLIFLGYFMIIDRTVNIHLNTKLIE